MSQTVLHDLFARLSAASLTLSRNQQKLIQIVAAILIAGSLVQGVFNWSKGANALMATDAAGAGIGAIIYWLTQKRRIELAKLFFLLSMWLLTVIEIWLSGSVRNPTYFILAVGIIYTGIFYARVALATYTLITILAMGALSLLENWQFSYQPYNFLLNYHDLLTPAGCLTVAAALTYYYRHQTDNALQHEKQLQMQSSQLQRDVARSQARLLRMIAQNPTPVLVQLARTAEIVQANPAFEKAFGMSQAQLLGKTDHCCWKDLAEREQFIERFFKQHERGWHRVTFQNQAGEPVPILMHPEVSEEGGDRLIITLMQVV